MEFINKHLIKITNYFYYFSYKIMLRVCYYYVYYTYYIYIE